MRKPKPGSKTSQDGFACSQSCAGVFVISVTVHLHNEPDVSVSSISIVFHKDYRLWETEDNCTCACSLNLSSGQCFCTE